MPRRLIDQVNRGSGLDAMDVLRNRRLIRDAIRLIETSILVDDEEYDLQMLFLLLGALKLLDYCQNNLAINFPRINLDPVNIMNQYVIRNQDSALFHLHFGRLSKVQAQNTFDLLGLPNTLTTENGYTFLSEAGFLIFLK